MKVRISLKTGLYLLLIFAIANASLRINENGMSSFFRILSPLAMLGIVCRRHKALERAILLMGTAVLYSIVVSIIGYGVVSYEYIIFALYIFVVYVIMVEIKMSSSDFAHSFWCFLHSITTLIIVMSFIQMVVRFPFPFVNLPRYPGVNLFMSNENELAEPLGFISLVYLYRFLFNKKTVYIYWILAIIAILFINDAKLTIIGCFIGYMCLLFFKNLNRKYQIKIPVSIKLGGVVFIVAILIVIIYNVNPILKFRDYSISLNELLFDDIIHILKLQPFTGGGSLVDRTNAIIYGLIELKKSHFIGIGFGNSVHMLTFSEYHLMTAKSMHNIIFQFLCEMGMYAITVYALVVGWVLKSLKKISISTIYSLKVTFVIAFVFISSQSSIGILSNYYSWIIIFYVMLISAETKVIKCKKL